MRFKRKESTIPLYFTPKEASGLKTFSEALVLSRYARAKIPRECACGCTTIFTPKTIRQADATLAPWHWRLLKYAPWMIPRVRDKQERIRACPFTGESLKEQKLNHKQTYVQMSKLLGVTDRMIRYVVKDLRTLSTKSQVIALLIFPNIILKPGFNREEFIKNHISLLTDEEKNRKI